MSIAGQTPPEGRGKKEGVRCEHPDPNRPGGVCGKLLMELRNGQLGIAHRTEEGDHFTPLEVLLSQAEQHDWLQENQKEERGTMEKDGSRHVSAKPFFSQIFDDEQLEKCRMVYGLSGSSAVEDYFMLKKPLFYESAPDSCVNHFMVICRAAGRVIGLSRSEFKRWSSGTYVWIADLIDQDYFRKETFQEEAVIFPTWRLFRLIEDAKRLAIA